MSEPVIQSLVARRIWDSRGRPTVEAEITLSDGAAGRGIAPAGASRGSREAIDKRDGGQRFGGFDVQYGLQGIRTEIAPGLIGLDPFDQAAIDAKLVALDGSPNKARLGGNALTAVSLGALHAAATSRGLPLWLYCLGDKPAIIPLPEIQIFGGGAHAGRRTDVQDFMVMAPRAKTFAEALEVTAEVYHAAGRIMAERGLLQGLADEGGGWPAFSSNEEALETLIRAIERAGFVPGEDVAMSLDIAASEFGKGGRYRLGLEQRELDRDALAEMLRGWCARYPILSIEDPFAENDDRGFEQFTAAVGDRIQVIGDDYLVTSASRVREAASRHSVNAVLVKVNQAGTVSEAKAALNEGRRAGFGTIVSARSGETEDTSIVHLAIGWGAGQLKAGSFARSERMAKWNEALRIEEGLGSRARFAGLDEMPMRRQGAKPVETGVVDAVHGPSIDGRPSGRPLDRAAALAERGYSGGRAWWPQISRSRAARSQSRSRTRAGFAFTRAFPMQRRRSARCVGARLSRLGLGPACDRHTSSARIRYRASSGTTSTSTAPKARRIVSISTSGRRLLRAQARACR